MSENTQGKLKGLKEKVSMRRNVSSTDNPVEQVEENVSVQTTEGTESRTTRYKRLLDIIVINGLLNIAEDKLSDDAFIESIFSKAYELLPVPVRLVVRREWCLGYLQSRKAPLLAQLQLYRAERHGLAEPVSSDVETALHPTLPPAI
ncbi:hypothetical protein ACROQ8_001036 [Yersinia enterocolitica]|uniref:hypothetical protein n=1 Tax=Yersinia enterocolitica TaxID=630 RepID=UPI0003D93F6F|nr:hypothetical protein [Yersinia enterocolitica]EKN6354132.1 hypothetical protein [Yersinia enterocolitica]ELX2303971.1 hypothetical protein [Yersinia enterocolitica]EME3600425.1 hypothetical protein [Yersinia enterocolitica]CCQ42134.1 hypothetical protein YE5303_28231 [Yersinia enterocolitica (type O:5) str. YE53/03]